MFTFSFGSAFAAVSWTGEATSKYLTEAADYDDSLAYVESGNTAAKGTEGITEAWRASFTAQVKAELKYVKGLVEGQTDTPFYAPEKAEAIALIEACIESLKTVKTDKDAGKLVDDLAAKVGDWTGTTILERVANGKVTTLQKKETVRAFAAAKTSDSVQITVQDGKTTKAVPVTASADGIAQATKGGAGSSAGDATIDLTRIARRNVATPAATIDNDLYLSGYKTLAKGTNINGTQDGVLYKYALSLTNGTDVTAKLLFVATPTADSVQAKIVDWFMDNDYREVNDFDAGSKAFAGSLVAVNSAYQNAVATEADAILLEIDQYGAKNDKTRKGLSVSEVEGVDTLVKKINAFRDKYDGLDYAKNILDDNEFKTKVIGKTDVSLAGNYYDQYAAEVAAVPEVKKLTDADKATVIALYKKVEALDDSYTDTWTYAKTKLATATASYDDYKRLNSAYEHFLKADVKAFNDLDKFDTITKAGIENNVQKYYFDASEKNVNAVKARRAAYDALVANYGFTDLNNAANGLLYADAAAAEADLLAAEHNQGADAAYDVKDTKKLQAYLNNATLKVTTKALGNSKIRVNARFDAETYKDIVAECGNDYTISYKFYQKSAKATSFKGPKEKSRNYITYTKASLKKGTKYKFQCGVVIKDAQGNVVAEKNYRASTTGSRVCR